MAATINEVVVYVLCCVRWRLLLGTWPVVLCPSLVILAPSFTAALLQYCVYIGTAPLRLIYACVL